MADKNYFEELYNIDVRDKIKSKQSLFYISWASSWAEVKKLHPDAICTVYEDECEIIDTTQIPSDDGFITTRTIQRTIHRPWFDDGNTAWVKVGITINGIEHIEKYPILDFKNKAIEANKVTSADANKSIQRATAKACARHGLALWIYEGEDTSEEVRENEKLVTECYDLIKKKCALGEETKIKVTELCKTELPEDCNGDPKLCEDLEVLKTLKRKLMAIRKVAEKKTEK